MSEMISNVTCRVDSCCMDVHFGSFLGSIQAALGICSLAGHLVSWQIAQTSMPPWPKAALEVPLQQSMRAIHIFPLKEGRMLPVIEKYDHITCK